MCIKTETGRGPPEAPMECCGLVGHPEPKLVTEQGACSAEKGPKVVSPSQKPCPERRPAREEPVTSDARVRSPELQCWLKAHDLTPDLGTARFRGMVLPKEFHFLEPQFPPLQDKAE